MLQARDLIGHQILWHIRDGSVNIWHENWTELGDLYSIMEDNVGWEYNNMKVAELSLNGEWDEQVIKERLPEELSDHILGHIKPPKRNDEKNKPCWMMEPKGVFTGLSMQGLHLREVLMLWWNANVKKENKPYYRAIPSFIRWELWRRRNRKKHEGKNTTISRIIYNVT